MINHIIIILALCLVNTVSASLNPDRTRIVLDEKKGPVVITFTNSNQIEPSLAQAWLEDARGHKVLSGALSILPPMQRVNAGNKVSFRVSKTAQASTLPDDRESLFYLNVREIPQKSEKKNTLTFALQTRMKVLYRPDAIARKNIHDEDSTFSELEIIRESSAISIRNASPYHISAVKMRTGERNAMGLPFQTVIAPFSTNNLHAITSKMSDRIILTVVNDYGANRYLHFRCDGKTCHVYRVTSHDDY